MTDERKPKEREEEQIEDLEPTADEIQDVKGGVSRKAGEGQKDFLEVKLENVQITSYQLG